MTTLTELGPAGIARAGSLVEDAILAMRRFLRGLEFMVSMAALFAWTLIDAGAPDGWPFGALAGAAFGLFLLMLRKKPRRPMGFNTVRRRSVASGQERLMEIRPPARRATIKPRVWSQSDPNRKSFQAVFLNRAACSEPLVASPAL
jgi:hypothetical protein